MKKFFKFVITFVILAIALIGILVLSANIPKDKMINNIIESAEYLKKIPGIERVKDKRSYTYLHVYADSVILNIIFCTDSNNAFESVVESKFYQKLLIDSNTDFVEAVSENKERKYRVC